MPLWGKNDNASNSAIYAVQQFNMAVTSANQTTLYQNTTPNAIINGISAGQFAVDAGEEEAALPPPAHSGWVLRTVGTGGRAGRVFQETLITMNQFLNDSTDPTYPNVEILILTQPLSSNTPKNNVVTLSVVAVTNPAGNVISYQWQDDQTTGVWANVSGANFANSNTSILTIANNTLATGNTFRVELSNTYANQVNSANALVRSF